MPTSPLEKLRWTLADGWTLVRREFWHMKSEPIQIVLPLIFSGALVLLFGYVFGSAISVPEGGNYREYLMPGLFAMASGTPAMINAVAIAREKSKGVVDRFRSMPMSRVAMPFGKTGSDIGIGIIALAMTATVGLLVGWRAHEGLGRTVAGFAILLFFRYAMSWAGVFLGLATKSETLDNLGPLFFPFIMISNAFVPTGNMPTWLRTIADWNPVSAVTQSARVLFGNPGADATHSAWPLEHPIIATLGWSVLLIVVFGSLAVHRYVTAED
jgi:ABC-2 type transport system permease protein